jgi:hypothetical protein
MALWFAAFDPGPALRDSRLERGMSRLSKAELGSGQSETSIALDTCLRSNFNPLLLACMRSSTKRIKLTFGEKRRTMPLYLRSVSQSSIGEGCGNADIVSPTFVDIIGGKIRGVYCRPVPKIRLNWRPGHPRAEHNWAVLLAPC